ncbi:MAG: hypothetical protein WD336_06470, partial [Trueperaceae bacterium]
HLREEDGPMLALPPWLRCVRSWATASGVERRSLRLALATLRLLPLASAHRVAALEAAAAPHGLPARRERFLAPGGRTVVLDGAHNPPAVRALASDLPAGARVVLGVAARKAPGEVLAALGPLNERAVLTAVVAGERPFGDDVRFVAEPREALARALADAPAGGTVAITGSFWLAGTLRPLLRTDPFRPEQRPEADASTP